MNVVEQTSMGVLVPSASQPFKIISDFKESGDQPSAIQNLVKNIQEGDNEQVALIPNGAKAVRLTARAGSRNRSRGKSVCKPELIDRLTVLDSGMRDHHGT